MRGASQDKLIVRSVVPYGAYLGGAEKPGSRKTGSLGYPALPGNPFPQTFGGEGVPGGAPGGGSGPVLCRVVV